MNYIDYLNTKIRYGVFVALGISGIMAVTPLAIWNGFSNKIPDFFIWMLLIISLGLFGFGTFLRQQLAWERENSGYRVYNYRGRFNP